MCLAEKPHKAGEDFVSAYLKNARLYTVGRLDFTQSQQLPAQQ